MSTTDREKRPLVTGLALLFFLLLLAGLGARFWASNQIIRHSGPTHIAADGEQVMLFAAGKLFHLSHAGELLGEIPLERSGLADDPIDLRFLGDGSLLVAGQQPATVRQCNLTTWDCRLVAAAAGLVEGQLKVLAGARPGEWFLTDARGDALWRLAHAAPPEALLPSGTLAGPNDLAFANDGALWVADTNHRRIVELVPTATGAWSIAREHSAVNEYTVGRGWYPMMLAQAPDGRKWVAQAAEFSEAVASLLIYDPEQGAQARVDLPGGAYPTDVVAMGNGVLVTDMDRFAVYRVASDTLAVSPFGDGLFLARLAEMRGQRNRYERVSRWALVAVIAGGVLMIGAGILATPGEKRWARVPAPFDWQSAPAEVPRVSGIHWLQRDPATDRSLKWAERLGYVLFLLPAPGALLLYLWIRAQAGPDPGMEIESKLQETGLALLSAGVLLALLVPIVRKSLRAMQNRLGTDGRRLYIRRQDGREIAVDPSQLAYTDRMILYREYTIPLTGGKQQSVYQPGEVETWLGPLLRRARKLSVTEGLKHQWKHRGGGSLWWLVIAFLFATTLILGVFALQS